MEELDKVKFTRIMRDLCNLMQKINQEDNIELRFNTSEDKFRLCRVEGDKAELLDWYAAPINCHVEE